MTVSRALGVTVACALLVVAGLTAPAAAQDDVTVCGASADPLVEQYNDNVDAVPGIASGLVTDETVHVVVAGGGDGGGSYTVVTGPDRRITELTAGAPASPTLVVETDCATVGTVIEADDPAAAFQREYRSGDVAVRGASFTRGLVVEAVEFGVDIADGLGLL